MVTPYRCTICQRCHGLADDTGMMIGVNVCDLHGADFIAPGGCPDWTPWIDPDECRAIITLSFEMARDGRV